MNLFNIKINFIGIEIYIKFNNLLFLLLQKKANKLQTENLFIGQINKSA